MSVKVGSKKEVYQQAMDYWENKINEINSKILESQKELSYAIQSCIDLVKQYNREGYK